jgi:hypothetical protein
VSRPARARMEERLHATGVPVRLIPVEEGRHGGVFLLPSDGSRVPGYLEDVVGWFDRHLGRFSFLYHRHDAVAVSNRLRGVEPDARGPFVGAQRWWMAP